MSMMKRYKDAENLFDNEEQVAKEMMAAAGTTQNENVPAPAGSESTLSADYLEKILQIQRNFSSQQEQSEKIVRSLNGLVRRLEGSKDIKVSLSEDDKNMLSALPVTINKHVATTVGQAGQKVKEDIDKHTESTMNSITKACDTKTEEGPLPVHPMPPMQPQGIAFGISYGSVCGYHSFSSFLSVAVLLSSFGSTIGNIKCRSSDNPSICKP